MAITTAIVGLSIVSMLQLIAAGTMSNMEGSEMTTAVNLARNVREYTLQQTFATVQTLDATTFYPPIDSRGVGIDSMAGWTQVVKVEVIDPNKVTANIVDATPDAVRVTVTVKHNGAIVGNVNWIRFAPS